MMDDFSLLIVLIIVQVFIQAFFKLVDVEILPYLLIYLVESITWFIRTSRILGPCALS